MKNDETLMREYRDGSEEAFGLLYEKYSPKVYGYLNKKMCVSEVDDVFQKVWRHLHEKRHLFCDQPFAPWFFVMIRNLVTDEYRSLARRDVRLIQDELKNERSFDSPFQEVEELIGTLNPETRELVRKYYLEGESYEDLEMKTGLSQSGLRQRLSRAVRGMRSLYEK